MPLHCRSLITYSLESIMYVNQQSSLAMPAPRAPMNQKIDTDNAMVQNHNAIYQQLLDQIREDNTYTHAVITLNPYGTAPLSLYPGV
ncbi:arylsulfatase [Salmonella enterica subsp. enterica serovar Heidelberg str. CFSAN002064]|uniref:Arylsulfatase n=2 Tax=Salmonella enterica subsp. enterica serovar Choleraesuis TaxID=119912 RepID=A0AAJ8WH49_SALET|nr:putative arylsulfatase [Salmonella enterica subsp. enterica serovar Choleraesuis str. SC-B67]AHB96364.1 arylsulfatase [Salmonella enterica subsp. enterica serovar Heidelberg str. CFSAN002064]EFZ04619.1 putative arylsulfatase [Salmonella enterica subsp. enterica serovar Choleraesuis str. SCSA50]